MARNLYDFYCNYIANFLSGGSLASKVNMSSLGIKPLYDRIITKSSVKKVICINQFPLDFNQSFSTILSRKVAEVYPDCKVVISMQSFKSELNVRSADFKRNMASAERRYNEEKQLFDSLSSTDKSVGRKLFGPGGASKTVTAKGVEVLKDNYDSYDYCNNVINNGGSLFTTYLFVEIVAPTNEKLIDVRDLVYKTLDMFKCYSSEVHSNSSKYMETVSPTGYMSKGNAPKEFGTTLMSHENLAQLMPFKSHGFVGDGTGTLMGVDMGPRTPFILNFYKTGDRQVVVFLCPSGKGKTLNSFLIAMSLLDSNIHCSVIDVKGDEWVKLGAFTKYINIDISSSNGVYVNTLRLDDVSVDESSCVSFYETGVSSTCSLFKTMAGFDEGTSEYKDSEFIIRNAINKYYMKNLVVKENPKTFIHSKNLTYLGLITTIQEIGETPAYRQYSDTINTLINRCLSIIEGTSLFKGRELTVKDIVDSPLVIYSLDKNNNQGDSALSDSIRTFMVSFLDMKKIYIRKQQGLGTTCFYEELQRKEEFKTLINFIVAVVTGARSSNVTVFLLCNSPSTLMSDDVQAITSNISTYIIGPLNNNDMEVLNYLGLQECIPRVKALSENREKFKHCFVCHFDTGDVSNTVTYRALVPPSILEKLKTRDAIDT